MTDSTLPDVKRLLRRPDDSCTNREACVDAMVNAIFPAEGLAETHMDHAACWCRPTCTYVDPVTETEVWVHRYADD